jgi:hypothetical protein
MPAIKHLAQTQSAAALAAAENNLLQGLPPGIAVPGTEPGEQLTHVLAARFVQACVQQQGCSLAAALRAFSARVRASIS